MIAHLRRKHIEPRLQRTHTNNFSTEMTRKQSKISRHTKKQDNLKINKNHQKITDHRNRSTKISDGGIIRPIFILKKKRKKKTLMTCLKK